jgi:small subunit ribosomal protein S11
MLSTANLKIKLLSKQKFILRLKLCSNNSFFNLTDNCGNTLFFKSLGSYVEKTSKTNKKDLFIKQKLLDSFVNILVENNVHEIDLIVSGLKKDKRLFVRGFVYRGIIIKRILDASSLAYNGCRLKKKKRKKSRKKFSKSKTVFFN